MGCCGSDREKESAVRAEQKWEYINLGDFKSHSCWTPFTYGVLWFNLFISVSVYAVDTFTAVNLLAFDRWSGQIKPFIPLYISRWIFAGCIILSFVLLFYRWLRAIRVIKASGVAQSYLDPLAVRIQSIRMGQEGRGWKRFLVFAELTKSRKGADYVALFSYFSFEAWTRICFAEGPRQVINALTLYSVMKLDLIPTGQHAAPEGHSPIAQFFVNIGVMWGKNREQVVILFGMLWTLVIWVLAAISLASSLTLYLLFLFHHIPSADGSLGNYCRRKINGRLERIVKAKVDKAIQKEEQLRVRQDTKDGKTDFKRQPTVPNLDGNDSLPMLSRTTTEATLPRYTSQAGSVRSSADSLTKQPTLPNLDLSSGRPAPPSRTATNTSAASWQSYGSNAPLMGEAGSMGYNSRAQTPASATTPGGWGRPPPSRNMSGMTQSSNGSFTPGPRSASAQGRQTPGTYPLQPMSRPGTAMSSGGQPNGRRGPSPSPTDAQGRRTPGLTHNPYFPPLPPSGRNTPAESQERSTPGQLDNPFFSPVSDDDRLPPNPEYQPRSRTPNGPPPRSYTPGGSNMRSLTGPVPQSAHSIRPPPLPQLQTSQSAGDYQAYTPGSYSGASPHPAAGPPPGPYRSYTQPLPAANYSGRQTPQSAQSMYPPRSGTAPPPRRQGTGDNALDDIVSGY